MFSCIISVALNYSITPFKTNGKQCAHNFIMKYKNLFGHLILPLTEPQVSSVRYADFTVSLSKNVLNHKTSHLLHSSQQLAVVCQMVADLQGVKSNKCGVLQGRPILKQSYLARSSFLSNKDCKQTLRVLNGRNQLQDIVNHLKVNIHQSKAAGRPIVCVCLREMGWGSNFHYIC